MAITDPIADMLTRLRNSGNAKHANVDIPSSKMKLAIAKILKHEGYIKNYKFIKDEKQGVLRIYLRYDDSQKHAILGLERISRPGRRMYKKCKEVKSVLNGMGIALLSTSKGIMTDREAKEYNFGGELLCNIW
ncbi:MAG: 30S ribosomal protein S8 [Desulfobacterales bacterium]|nr:30S ribosomal protein S8 [Desulfobacterales bacterium]